MLRSQNFPSELVSFGDKLKIELCRRCKATMVDTKLEIEPTQTPEDNCYCRLTQNRAPTSNRKQFCSSVAYTQNQAHTGIGKRLWPSVISKSSSPRRRKTIVIVSYSKSTSHRGRKTIMLDSKVENELP